MGRGRKPKPTKLKILDGSAAKNPNRVNQFEPEPAEGSPRMPTGFDDHAKRAWKELTTQLSQMRVLTHADKSILELYAATYSRYRECLKHVEENGSGLTDIDEYGNVKVVRNPFSTELHKHRDALIKILSEVGMTPTARTKLQVAPKEDDNETRFFGKEA